MEASQMMGLYHIEVATYEDGNNKFMFMMGKDHHHDHHDDEIDIGSESTISSSNLSKGSSSSDLLDDASSSLSPPSPSSSSSSPRQSNSPLYEFSNLMEQLPIKKGLSNYYQGRSQSFTSLAKAQNLEDLAKKETSYQRKLKACRSYGGDLNNFRSYNNNHPKAAISKKPSSKGSLSNLSCLTRNSSFIDSCRPPLAPPQSSY